MKKTLILTQKDVESLIDMKTALCAVEAGFRAQGYNKTSMPPKVYISIPDTGDFRAMPAHIPALGACGIKWVNVHPANRIKGLPSVMATIIINDPKNGFPIAILEGMSVTRFRTGAAAGIAAKTLARRNSSVIALIGCGAQAYYQILALKENFRISKVNVWGYFRGEASRFCKKFAQKLALPLEPFLRIRECTEQADIIVTITNSKKPILQKEWVRPGTHINAIGADAPGKQELDPEILKKALVTVDDIKQACHSGEINVPISKGHFKPSMIHATLAEVLMGRKRGRSSEEQITVFDSTGIAIHDIALARVIMQRAIKHGLGRPIQLFSKI